MVIATLRCGGLNRARGKKEGMGERKLKMGILGEGKLKEFREKMDTEVIGRMEEEGIDTLLEKF